MIISNQDKQDSKESILDKFVASVLGGLFFVLDKLGIR